jgi:F0F1-type ATP synthase membrane subunit a
MNNIGTGELILLTIVLSWIIGFYLIGRNKTLPIIEKIIWLAFNFFIPLIGLIGYILYRSKKTIIEKNNCI